ncbi:MAG: ornithine carbamoyltransferase [Alphaproteobacteria bacterium]
MVGPPRHFLDIDRFSQGTLQEVLDLGLGYKRGRPGTPLTGRVLAMIFEKPSTRTRVSFEVAMKQLGGEVVLLDGHTTQLTRGETVADTARVLSRYVDAIMMRTDDPARLNEMAEYATVPVINGLTNTSHPCQLMADVMTIQEHRGAIENQVITWCGDGNNVAASWIQGAARFGYKLRLACPPELAPAPDILAKAKSEGVDLSVLTDIRAAVSGADAIVTDAWVSMHENASINRHNLLAGYQVNQEIMRLARPDAIFMHCLPAHRGEEVTSEVIDGPQSVVFDEAENRLHAQKGILAWCLGSENR